MNDLSPYEKLGVSEEASFDEIQNAKKSLTLKYKNDVQVVETIEAAYDAIIMDRLKMRQEGKIKVPDQIRFPEKIAKPQKTPFFKKTPNINNNTSNWLESFIDTPSPQEIIVSGLIYLGLAVITVFNQEPNLTSFLLTLGVGTNFYFIYRKHNKFWRTTGITFAFFVMAIALGNFLAPFIGSSDFTLEQFVCLFSFCLFWLISNFLR